jgi:tetratricopeptide (TPR) repeat protein
LQQEIGDPKNEAWSVLYLGMVDLKQANYVQSAERHQHALELARSRQDTFQEGIHLTNLGRVTMRLGQYDTAYQQFQHSLELKQKMNDLTGQGFSLYYQGLVRLYQGD